jgi:hypothetical protein
MWPVNRDEDTTGSYMATKSSARKAGSERSYYVYVVELSDDIGPRVRPDRPSVYVGQSVQPHQVRSGNIAGDHESLRDVRKYGFGSDRGCDDRRAASSRDRPPQSPWSVYRPSRPSVEPGAFEMKPQVWLSLASEPGTAFRQSSVRSSRFRVAVVMERSSTFTPPQLS